MQGPMPALVQRMPGDRVARFPNLAAAPRLVCEARNGIAHHLGETLLAVREYDFDNRGRAQGSHAFLLFTDRRVFGELYASNIRLTPIDLPLAAVTGATAEGGLLSDVANVATPQGPVRIPLWGKDLVAYLRSVTTVPPDQRTAGPLVVAPGQGDPIGAHAATSLFFSRDPIVAAIPRVAFEVGRQGKLPEASLRAILERAVILDHTLATGRGMHEGQWLSTLPRPALVGLFAGMLGDPLGSQPGPTWEMHDFGVTPGGRSAGAALASSALGLASAAILGVGWISRAGGGLGFSALRATFVDFPCGSGVQLVGVNQGRPGPLSFSAARLLEAMWSTIARLELRALVAEVAFAGSVPPERLPAAPRAELEAALTSLGVPMSLAPLYPS